MLPTAPASLVIERIALEGDTVVLEGHGASEAAACPACGATSQSVHERYRRRPLDLPWRGRVVRLVLTIRRFRCPVAGCPRQTFAEDFGTGLPRPASSTASSSRRATPPVARCSLRPCSPSDRPGHRRRRARARPPGG